MKHFPGRLIYLGVMLAISCAMLGPSPTFAQTQSTKPIRFIVITAAGGAADQAARIVAQKLSTAIGRVVVVENRPGAGGNIASHFVANAPADGSTFLVTSNNHTINPSLYKDAGYDTLKDLEPVIQIARGPTVIAVNPSVPVHTMKELIALSKSKYIAYGSIGVGSAAHLVGECLKPLTGAAYEHVPYKGGAPAVADTVAGHTPLVMSSLASVGEYLKSGGLRPIAVSTAERWHSVPDVPTLAELGMGDCTYDIWLGLVAPHGTPPAIIASMNREIATLLKLPDVVDRITAMGYLPVGASTEKFDEMVRADMAKTSKLIKQANIKSE